MHTVMQFSIIKNKTFIQTQPSFYFFSFFFFNSLVPFIFNYLLLASLGSNPESHALTHTTDNDPFLLANVTYSVLPWKKNNNNNDNKPNKNKHKEKKPNPHPRQCLVSGSSFPSSCASFWFILLLLA